MEYRVYLQQKQGSGGQARWGDRRTGAFGRSAGYRGSGTCGRGREGTVGTIDAVVCNAGIAEQKLFQNITDADWMRMLDVNLMGTVRTIRAVLPEMLHNHKGSIVTVSSMWGECGASCESHYSASKAAIIGLSKSLAQELGPSNIRVNCIAPGVIDTDMNAMHSADTMQELADQTPLGRVGAAAEVADSILYLCSDKSSFITGQVLGVTGGF